jgi:hypothetical protein
MKKLFIAFGLALLALVILAAPTLAYCPSDASADVDCGEIDVTDSEPAVGTTITFSGTVTIDASSTTGYMGFVVAAASSNGWYEIRDPDGNVVASGNSPLHDTSGWYPPFYEWPGYSPYTADASQTYTWSAEITVELVGDYVAEHGGEASVVYGHWEYIRGPYYSPGHWEFRADGSDYDSCSASRTVTSHDVTAAFLTSHPMLVIVLPDGTKRFFGKDGWGNPTSDGIVYTDGTWQVDIDAGTIVQLDGKWHKVTYLEIDGEGNVTGKYGNGANIAQDIGLSQPITITKVG